MHGEGNDYGLWFMVFINSAIFIGFAFSFYHPKTNRDWRSFGAFSAFVVAFFTEMYGFPLTIYLLSGWLQSKYPNIDILSHNAGHLWHTLLGWKGDPHFDPFHILSYILIIAGFFMLSSAWKILYEAQRTHTMAQEGPYRKVRHPQYVAFILIMIGFLFQWPTILTLIMFPILVFIYMRLAKKEEQNSLKEFGEQYEIYMRNTPAFFPKLNERS